MGNRPSRSRATSPAASPSPSPSPSPSRPARRLSVPAHPPPNPPSLSPQVKRATDAAQAYAQSHSSHFQSHEWEIYPPQLEGQFQTMTIAEDDEEIFQRINTQLEKIPFLPAIEARTGISKLNLVFFLAFLSLLLIAHIAGASSIVNFVAFVYPAYMSYKTLQSDDVMMHRHWLIYWVVYGLFHVCEVVGDVTLYWIPYYYPLKILFLVWCFHPHYRGCSIMYEYGMRPFLIEHQLTIDDVMEYIQTTTSRAIVEIRQVTTELMMQIAVNVIRTVTGRDQLSRPPPARDGVGQWMDSPPSPASGRMSPMPQQHVSPLIRQRSVSRPHAE